MLASMIASSACVEERRYLPWGAPPQLEVLSPLSARSGERLLVPVKRLGSEWREALELRAAGLPRGISAEPVMMAPGQELAELPLRVDDAPSQISIPFLVEAVRGDGSVMSMSASLVVSNIGSIDRATAPIIPPPATQLIPLGVRAGDLLFASTDAPLIYAYGPDGKLDPTFGDSGIASYADALGVLRKAPGTPVWGADDPSGLNDGAFYLATTYDDPSTEEPRDGALLVRFNNAGAPTQGSVNGAPLPALHAVPLPGHTVRGAVTKVARGTAALWATNAAGELALVRVLLGGAPVIRTNIEGIELTRPVLHEQTDGKIIAVVAGGLVRFHADLQRDLSFGTAGRFETGVEAADIRPYHGQSLMIAGSVSVPAAKEADEPRIVPALWRLDWQGRFPPEFPPEGLQLLRHTGRALSLGLHSYGVFVAASGPSGTVLLGATEHGEPDLEMGAAEGTPGHVSLPPLHDDEQVLFLSNATRLVLYSPSQRRYLHLQVQP